MEDNCGYLACELPMPTWGGTEALSQESVRTIRTTVIYTPAYIYIQFSYNMTMYKLFYMTL